MNLTPEMTQALATAARQWHAAQRQYETASKLFADAQTQLQLAERDLHELARAIEVATSSAAQVVTPSSSVTVPAATPPIAPVGSVTMPIMPAGPIVGTVPSDGLDAAEIVKAEMMRMRMGNP